MILQRIPFRTEKPRKLTKEVEAEIVRNMIIPYLTRRS